MQQCHITNDSASATSLPQPLMRGVSLTSMIVNFLNLKSYFRDDEQRCAVQNIVQYRLADDRIQEECRYLMRFWWQLSMSYQEVTLDELENFVSGEKFKIILELLDSLAKGYQDIDVWCDKYSYELSIIEDRGYQTSKSQ